jgi:predicted dehydrogenase
VYCEKPLALTVAEAREIAAAARSAGTVHIMGFNYITNPLIELARSIVNSGEIGEPIGFAGRYFEDYMASPEVPHSWRCERRYAGAGALADLGSHLVNLLHHVLGRPRRVMGTTWTVIRERVEQKSGRRLPVENEDMAAAHLELESGLPATFEISRVAAGYKCGLCFEVFGSRGSLRFDQERMNELRLYYAGDAPGRRGFRTILAGPEHADYARFCPAPGHGLGINDLKIIEVRNFLRAIATGTPAFPGFDEGLRVQQVMEAIETSAAGEGWATLEFE